MKTMPIALALLASLLVHQPGSAAASEDREELEEVMVTGSLRVAQGGTRDINFFRGEAQQERIPHPDTFTAEGLFGGYDLQLPGTTPCGQLFCLIGEAGPVSLPHQQQAEVLVGLSFATNLDGEKWRRPPLNIVAVVDKSGSMQGEPLDLVRRSLAQVIEQLQPGDQLAVVLYGDRSHVYLPQTRLTAASKREMLHAVAGIESAGSTNMESGLRLGYQVAVDSAANFKGLTRVMLFTDEQPNVGRTDAASFMGMAIEASTAGVGLTTIGVGQQFGAALAVRMSSVRGGNSFFMRDRKDVEELFDREFDFMVSELAHDLSIEVEPQAGYKIAGIYGVPGELLGWQDQGAASITVPTVFLSTRGGGIFVALGREPDSKSLPRAPLADGSTLVKIKLSYKPVSTDVTATDALSVAYRRDSSGPMRLAAMLVDEFTTLRHATSEFHLRNDPRSAYHALAALSTRLAGEDRKALKTELETVGLLEARLAFLSGYGSEGKDGKKSFVAPWGKWRVSRSDADITIHPRDILEFTPDGDFMITRGSKRRGETDEMESYRSNNNQLYLDESGLLFTYTVRQDQLVLTHDQTGIRLYARRIAVDP
jgi:Ca-activated chloride channel homolog